MKPPKSLSGARSAAVLGPAATAAVWPRRGVLWVAGGTPALRRLAGQQFARRQGLIWMEANRWTLTHRYIGETEKNLAQLVTYAARRGAVLFFDEADALFGKRTEVKDAHDRFAQVKMSSLLDPVEAVGGVVILSAAKKPTKWLGKKAARRVSSLG
jgi:ATP-dependent 26S proteasome regulatory subunit